MTTAGIIGGLGPESTVDYYTSIISTYREQKRDGSYPSLIINSVDFSRLIRLVEGNALEEMTEYLSVEINRLAMAEASFAALSANTPHIVFDGLRNKSSIPLLSIVEATCDAATGMGLRRLGLLGTRFTMQGSFYSEVFARRGVALVVPDADEQAFIHHCYMTELLQGNFLPETKQKLIELMRRLTRRENLDGIILAGTELPLILRDADPGIPLLDTTRIHVKAIVARLL